MESADSIRSLYRHFLSAITQKSLTAFYYACSYSKADYSRFMNVTASLALKLIPDSLKSQPVFFCIDDTMISKFGRKFEDVSKLFDHAAHNGSNYLNGHCFVSLMLCVPIWSNRRIARLPLWQKKRIETGVCRSHGAVKQHIPCGNPGGLCQAISSSMTSVAFRRDCLRRFPASERPSYSLEFCI